MTTNRQFPADFLWGAAAAAYQIEGAVDADGRLVGILSRRGALRRTGADGPADPRVVPLLLAAVSIAGFLASPAQNTVSRALESRADRVALATTDDPVAFAQLQRVLARRSLSDPTPPADGGSTAAR